MINVLGDAYGAGIVEHLSKADLAKADRAEEAKRMEDSEHVSSNGSPIYATPHKAKAVENDVSDHDDTSLNESRMTTYC